MASQVQNIILTKLLRSEKLRYGELKPEDVANDLFNYHLQFLVKKCLVDKLGDGYKLSVSGVKHVADEYPLNPQGEVANLFKMNAITIISRNTKNGIEILNQVRGRHPSFGKKGIMGGSARKGEKIADAASRKLFDETGLKAEFRLLGFERRIMKVEDELFSDILFCICYSDEILEGDLKAETEFGHNEWVSIEEAMENDSSAEFDSIKSIGVVLEAIKDERAHELPFFFEEVLKADK